MKYDYKDRKKMTFVFFGKSNEFLFVSVSNQ